MSTAAAAIRGLLMRLGWLVAAVAIAAGASGIVASVGGPVGIQAHPELTWAGDRAIQPGFDAALGDLERLSDQVDRLGVLGRGALAALAARDQAQLAGTITDGSDLVADIGDASSAIRKRLRALPGVEGDAPPLPDDAAITLGPATRARYAALDAALTTTEGLDDAWVRLTAGSLAAIRLSTVLAEHDASTAALKQLETSKRLIDDASKQRDTLQNTVDVSTLTRWLSLNSSYDTALRKLYDALRRSNGRATDEVRKAFAAEARAHDQLPPDTRALVVIMGEIARGGLNQAVIAIEDARGELASAIDALSAPSGPPGESAPPGTEPSASPSPPSATASPPASAAPTATRAPTPAPSRTFPAIVTPAPSS